MTIRHRVAPKHLPKVKDEHLDGVFGEFDDVIDRRLSVLEASELPFDAEKARFFRHLKELVDSDRFGEMQAFQLDDSRLRLDSDMVKYIDPTVWFESKLVLAQICGIDKRAPIDILDIGTGPGHWPVVAEFYGHRVLGSDIPQRASGMLEKGHLYDVLGDIYKIRRIPLRIDQFTPLPPLERRFDLVTAFLAAFNVDPDKKPWGIEAWNFFMKDLRENVLAEGGEVFMTLADGKLTDEVWNYLKSHAVFSHDKMKQIHWKDLTPFG